LAHLTALLTAFAYLTRYAGLALFATFLRRCSSSTIPGANVLSARASSLRDSFPLVLGWGIRNRLLADNATNRTIVYHPITAENIGMGIYNISFFLMPVEEWRRTLMKIPNLVAGIMLAIGLILLVWILYKGLKKFFQPSTETPEVLSFVSVLYVFAYLSSLIVTMTWFDAATKFQLRILAPIYVSLLTMLVYFSFWLWKRQRPLTIVLVLSITVLSLHGMTNHVPTPQRRTGLCIVSLV
jgi:hypothetical protein